MMKARALNSMGFEAGQVSLTTEIGFVASRQELQQIAADLTKLASGEGAATYYFGEGPLRVSLTRGEDASRLIVPNHLKVVGS